MKTIADLKAYAKRQARLDTTNYLGAPEALRDDRNYIRSQRRAAIKAASFYWTMDNETLMPGTYANGRLIITEDEIDYTPGQHAPTEIYWAIKDYFDKTREK